MIEKISEIARLAGETLLKMKSGNIQRFSKGVRDFATEADLASQDIIVSNLKKSFPNISILAEEDSEHLISDETFFVVDPLDGTFNYTFGFDTWGVLIGLIEKGVPHSGIIYLPEKDVMISAEKSNGAFYNGEKIELSQISTVRESVISVELGSWLNNEVTVKYGVPIVNNALFTRSLGCSAAAFSEMFKGASSSCVSIFGSKIWDLAACSAILLEAGGTLSDLSGAEISWKNVSVAGAFSSNMSVHRDLISILNTPKLS